MDYGEDSCYFYPKIKSNKKSKVSKTGGGGRGTIPSPPSHLEFLMLIPPPC